MMKGFLLGILAVLAVGSAQAADMPVKRTTVATNAYAAEPLWGGFNVSGHFGYALIDTDPSFLNDSLKGFTYGGGAEYLVQKGWLVGGLGVGLTNYAEVKLNGFGCDCVVADLYAKVGAAVNNFLVYGTAGGFWHNASLGGLPQFGWTVGAGVDWMPFGSTFVIGPEYRYRNLDVPNTALTVFAHDFRLNARFKF